MADNSKNRHPVLFVGAGPGDPDLITVAGRNALEAADVVVYAGSLVSGDMLTWTKENAEIIDSAPLDLDRITGLLIDRCNKGLKVVRLHTGDPSLYGAVREQFDALEKNNVPYRIIPGVTAAFAAAAVLGIEYTLPEITQTLILTRTAGRTPVPDAEKLSELAGHKAGMVIYLSAGQAESVAEALIPAYGPDASVAIVYRASWPEEKTIWTTAARLADDMKEAGINKHALIIVGKALDIQKIGGDAPKSKLYDSSFSHEFRFAEK